MNNEKLTSYAVAILKANNYESAYQKVADQFEDDLLESDDFPTGYFEFVLDLLSNKNFYSKPGLWNFLLVLSTENHKLSAWHYEVLSNTILNNYLSYLDEDLCLAACDFIARNYPELEAKKTLLAMKNIEQHKNEHLQKFADEGLKILSLEVERNRQQA